MSLGGKRGDCGQEEAVLPVPGACHPVRLGLLGSGREGPGDTAAPQALLVVALPTPGSTTLESQVHHSIWAVTTLQPRPPEHTCGWLNKVGLCPLQ